MLPLRDIVTKKLGVDKAIFYTLMGRGLQITTALFTVLFITRFLSPEEQGYYYTFGSIVAIQVFFELGLTGIITQYVAHEAVHLSWDKDYNLIGEDKYKSRLSSLLRFCAKWYCIFAVLIVIALLIVGVYFFSKYNHSGEGIIWKLPWILLVIGTAFNFLLAPVTAFIEGLGKVKEMAQIRLVQQVIHPIVVWGGLAIGSKLFVSGADAILRVLVVGIIIVRSPFFAMLRTIWREQGPEKIYYKTEIFPLQWRIAVSWISGYFIFQIFNPVLFATEGPVVAGQMGMSMTALNAMQAMSMSWISTKVPKLSGLIEMKQYAELDRLFNRTMKQMLLIGTAALMAVILIVFLFQYYDIALLGMYIGRRFLPVVPLMLMAWAAFTNFLMNGWAVYLRCHKKEPIMWNSVTMGILCCTSTVLFGKLFGLYGICIGFAILRTFSMIWIYLIFKTKKREWHEC